MFIYSTLKSHVNLSPLLLLQHPDDQFLNLPSFFPVSALPPYLYCELAMNSQQCCLHPRLQRGKQLFTSRSRFCPTYQCIVLYSILSWYQQSLSPICFAFRLFLFPHQLRMVHYLAEKYLECTLLNLLIAMLFVESSYH